MLIKAFIATALLADVSSTAAGNSNTSLVIAVLVGAAAIVLGGLVMREFQKADNRRSAADAQRATAEQQLLHRVTSIERRVQQLREALIAAVPSARAWIRGFEQGDRDMDMNLAEGTDNSHE